MDLTIPFRVRGKSGMVIVNYGVNEDPERWGDLLLGFDAPPDISKGFPVCRATVTYDAEGYAAVMAWIQVLSFHGAENGVQVDQSPQLEGTDMPYVYWGPWPTFFDNPFTDARGVHWTADAFLTVCPTAVMTRVVQPVCGFHWGYSTEGEGPQPLPLTVVDPTAWTSACELLRERYPTWTFLPDWANELAD